MKKIVVTQDIGLTIQQKEKLNTLGDVKYFDTVSNTQQEWLDRVQGVDIIYSEEPFMHENLPYIKNCFLTFPFTAFLKQVDIDELKVHNVITASAKGGNKYAVAERNIMALLHLTRNFSQINMTKENLAWSFLSSITGVRDLEVIILGKGNIGTVTGELCQGIGMRVDFYQRGDDLTQKLKGKQVIINCLRHNITTTGIVNTNALQGFTGYYISAAGHKTENQQELVDLLKNGILQGFARDGVSGISSGDVSFPNYQKLKTDLDGYNTFITPAIASFTTNAIKYSNDICIENIRAYIQGNPINLLY